MSEFLKHVTRYNFNQPTIVVDRYSPVSGGKLEASPEGAYMAVKDLQSALAMGVMFELNEEIADLHADGQAQRALMRTLTSMGFENFEQVIKCLEQNRHTVLEEREFEIWDVGYQATGEYKPPSLLGKAKGLSFNDACEALRNAEIAKGSRRFNDWFYQAQQRCWRNYCGNLQPTKPGT
jgi:hypothetical protein